METASQPVVTFVYFSYTKQTKNVVDAMSDAFRERGFEVRDAPIGFSDHRWTDRFSKFPLPMVRLLGMLIPQMRGATGEISVPDAARKADSDLVVIGGPTWFFRTSIPIRSYLKSPDAKALLHDKPFATFVVARRYWSINQGWVRKHATKVGGHHLDSTHLLFQGGQVKSLISLLSYLTSGEMRERRLGIKIPPSNLREEQLAEAKVFATSLADKQLATSPTPTPEG